MSAAPFLDLPADDPGREVDEQGEDHKDGRDGEGYVKLALLLGIGVQGDGQRRAGAGKAYDKFIERVREARGEQKRGGLA